LSLAIKNYQAAIDRKQTIQWEETSVYPSGTKTGIVSVTPVFDSDDNCSMLVGSVHDITTLKKIESEILKEKQLSDSVINSLPGVFYLYNSDGNFLRWNKNLEQVSKYDAEEIRLMHPLDFFDTEEKKLLDQKIKNTFITGEDNVQANFLLKTKQKIPYYFTGKAIDYEGSKCLMGVGIDFSERIKAQEKIKETTEQLRLLTAHLQSIREEERKRIGREIHDELGQQLTAIKMDIAWIDKKVPDDNPLLKNKLKNVITLLDGSNQSIRRILSELRPGILDNHGLLDALEWLNRQVSSTTGLAVQFNSNEIKTNLPEPITTCIFRVYQEALTNIIRYAGAAKVLASLLIDDNVINVSIEDDGKGFDPASVQVNKSFGILGMKERVLSLGGNFELLSSPGEGTKIFISLPL
jgi:PAS domain S-box-containing protein